jgi:hypothetical protein
VPVDNIGVLTIEDAYSHLESNKTCKPRLAQRA